MQKWGERHRGVPWPSCTGGVARDTRSPESLLSFPPPQHTSGLPWKRAPDILGLFLPSSSEREKGPHPTNQPRLVGPMGDISSDSHTAQPAQPRLFRISGPAFWSVSEPAGLSVVQNNCPASPSPPGCTRPIRSSGAGQGQRVEGPISPTHPWILHGTVKLGI